MAIGAAFSHTLGTAGIPEKLLGPAMDAIGQNQVAALALIAVAFFIGCMFVDPIVVILILVPIFKPLIESANLDPIHVGVIVTLQAAIGSATPPFGCDIFTAIAVFRRPYLDVIRGHAAVYLHAADRHFRADSVPAVVTVVAVAGRVIRVRSEPILARRNREKSRGRLMGFCSVR